jgi:hypothetical protein
MGLTLAREEESWVSSLTSPIGPSEYNELQEKRVLYSC